MKEENLTPAERRVLGTLKDNQFISNDGIAQRLNITVNTVKTHLKNIYRKEEITGNNRRFKLLR